MTLCLTKLINIGFLGVICRDDNLISNTAYKNKTEETKKLNRYILSVEKNVKLLINKNKNVLF